MMLNGLLAALVALPFNDGWEFCRQGELDWRSALVPHDALRGLPYCSEADPCQGFVRTPKVTYRKKFICPNDEDSTSYAIKFDGVYMDSSVFLNGRLIGGRPNGFVPFEVPLAGLLPSLHTLEVETENLAGERDIIVLRYGIRTIRFSLKKRWFSTSWLPISNQGGLHA